MVRESYNRYCVPVLNGDEGKGKPVEKQPLRAHLRGLACYGDKRRTGFLEKLCSMFEGINEAAAKAGFLVFIPRRGFLQFAGSFPADVNLQVSASNTLSRASKDVVKIKQLRLA